jgi:hypothetical protein
MNIVSLLIGFVTLIATLVAFVPLLGWMNWLIIPFAVVGFALGQFARAKAGRNLNLLVIVVGVVRLSLGGGLI